MLPPVPPSPYVGAPARATVRFRGIGGAAGNLAAPIIKAAMENEQVKKLQKSGRLKNLVLANVIGIASLFPVLWFNPAIAQRIQQSGNHNVALTAIHQPGADPARARQVLEALDRGHVIGDRDFLYDMAGVGFVREVIAEGTDDTEGKAVLKDGRTVDVPLDDDIRARLREEYGVPVVHSLAYGVPLDPKVAAAAAAVLTNILLFSFTGLSTLVKRHRPETAEEDALSERFYIEAIGRFIVANELGVTRAPITAAHITAENDLFDNVEPLTRDDLWKRMVVLPSGYIAEHNYFDGDVSVMSAKKPGDLMEVARAAVAEVGLCMDRNLNPLEIAKMTPQEQEALAQELARAAFEQAKRILASYKPEQLDLLGEALQQVKGLTKEEGRALLRGEKTLEEIREAHRLFGSDSQADRHKKRFAFLRRG